MTVNSTLRCINIVDRKALSANRRLSQMASNYRHRIDWLAFSYIHRTFISVCSVCCGIRLFFMQFAQGLCTKRHNAISILYPLLGGLKMYIFDCGRPDMMVDAYTYPWNLCKMFFYHSCFGPHIPAEAPLSPRRK